MEGTILLVESSKVSSILIVKFEFERFIGFSDTLLYLPSQFTSIEVNGEIARVEVNKN